MYEYKMTIEKVDNGYLLEFPDVYADDEDDVAHTRREVISEDDGRWGNLEAGQSLLYRVMEFFDLSGSKHDERRLQVSVSGPGDVDESSKGRAGNGVAGHGVAGLGEAGLGKARRG